MVKVIYENDIKYNLDTATLDEIKNWPHSKLIEYHLEPKKLSREDLAIIRSTAYSKLISRHKFTYDTEYSSQTFVLFIRKLIVFPVLFTFLGFLFGYFTYFRATDLFTNINYLSIFYFLFSSAVYFASLFALQIVTNQIFLNKLKNSGRLLFPNELYQGLTAKFILSWLIIQVFIHLTMYLLTTI
ncbi:hypothetical protein CKF54_06240 [Psittacicella hinzii]|uniref:Uncharacterized protein n=1 Tax=Psittacicella hinzii TaxID=2028575 RepID=A0A3A1Y0D0_9GAMM|nr:hypothetical protein [Psittacicella hinzii]RIY31703.1 hypothetical protein CKF54_06240 [Psittacicella hinzii]